ncbi:hypothetical protein SRHO_G00306160 [Serrasalmus rhombeus]
MHSLVAIRLLVLVLGLCSLRVAGQGRSTPATCSPLCRCDEDGGADCSGKGLSTVPAGLSAFTYYLLSLASTSTSMPSPGQPAVSAASAVAVFTVSSFVT